MGGRGRFLLLRRRRRRGDDKKNSGKEKGKWRKGKIEVGIVGLVYLRPRKLSPAQSFS